MTLLTINYKGVIMITVNNIKYKILENNQFENMQTHKIVDGDNLSGNIHFGSGNNLSGARIGNHDVEFFSFDCNDLKIWIGRIVCNFSDLCNQVSTKIQLIFNRFIDCFCCCASSVHNVLQQAAENLSTTERFNKRRARLTNSEMEINS